MAINTTKGTLVTNYEASPPTPVIPGLGGGKSRTMIGSVTIDGSVDFADVGDIILLAPIQSNALLIDVEFINIVMDSNTTDTLEFDLGLYTSAGVVVDADIYGDGSADDALFLGTAHAKWTSILHQTAAEYLKPVWEDAAATSDPSLIYYIGMTLTAAVATAVDDDILYKITYSVD